MGLFDASVEILKEVDISLIENVLKLMNVKRNKMVHLMDSLNATYIHSSYQEVIALLSSRGFTNFRRLSGGAVTDFDPYKVESDRYGKEKFGEGDIRIFCQLSEK